MNCWPAHGLPASADRPGCAIDHRYRFHFLVSALDVPDRRARGDLLAHYLKALATFGVSAPGVDEAWDDYRRATVYGFLCWLCNPDIWQPADVNTATCTCFGTAMLDHDTYAALGV